ncbi:uncharacterized protein V6R79_013114 [Siganus canaliculatus]
MEPDPSRFGPDQHHGNTALQEPSRSRDVDPGGPAAVRSEGTSLIRQQHSGALVPIIPHMSVARTGSWSLTWSWSSSSGSGPEPGT